LSAARTKLATQGGLSTDDLIFLTKETVMNDKRAMNLEDIYQDVAAKHLSESDRALLKTRGLASLIQPDDDEARRLMEADDPGSIAAMDLAKRWMGKVFESTGADRELTEKVRDVARDLHGNPEFQQASSSSTEMMEFVQKAYGAAIKAGLMPAP
jgi:MerR family transcriptional regulator, thiopeptide resistance regulator